MKVGNKPLIKIITVVIFIAAAGIYLMIKSREMMPVVSGISIPGIDDSRLIDWTEAGVSGGIPDKTKIFMWIDSASYGDGIADASIVIQNAINACPPGQVVYIPQGTYRLNKQLIITKGIILRGAGHSRTILKTFAEWHGIQMGDWPSENIAVNVAGSLSKGDAAITITDASSFSAGDFIVIDQTDDGVEVINVDDQSRDGNTRSLSQMTKITNIKDNILSIHPPLYHDYVSTQNPQVWKIKGNAGMTTFAGIEDLCIERIQPSGTEGYSNIKMVACAYCWVKNIESRKAQFRHVDLDRSFRNTIRDCYFNNGMHHGTGGFAYGVVCSNRSTDNLIENNIFYHLRHSMVIKEGAAGNVFGYNYSVDSYQGEDWLAADINAHGAHSHMNLFEGNVVCKAYADFTHGSSSYNTLFRNESRRASSAVDITLALRAVDLEKVQYYYNIVGNVFGKADQDWTALEDEGTRQISEKYVYTFGYPSDGADTATDPQTKATVIRHGNFDYFNRSVSWDSEISGHILPNSLYLTSKPAWFPEGFSWPPIGPDVINYVTKIPAEKRYEEHE